MPVSLTLVMTEHDTNGGEMEELSHNSSGG